MDLFSGAISSLENGLNYASVKQKTISQNIANAETPNYKAEDVSFNTTLQQAMLKANKSDSRDFDFKNTSQSTSVFTRTDTSYNHNGNNVDVDKEMTQLAQNQIYQQALVQQLNKKFNNIMTVVRDGK